MPSSEHRSVPPAPGAVAIVEGDPPHVLLADGAAVMSRLVARLVVAASDPGGFTPDRLATIREALLAERRAEAVGSWTEATGIFIDIYEQHVPVWSEADLEEEIAAREVRLSRIFVTPA